MFIFRLLHVQAIYCMFTQATLTFNMAVTTIELLKEADELPNLAGLYTEFSLLLFIRCEYDKAYKYSIEALKQLNSNLPPRYKHLIEVQVIIVLHFY